jgi:hypothetical protein
MTSTRGVVMDKGTLGWRRRVWVHSDAKVGAGVAAKTDDSVRATVASTVSPGAMPDSRRSRGRAERSARLRLRQEIQAVLRLGGGGLISRSKRRRLRGSLNVGVPRMGA